MFLGSTRKTPETQKILTTTITWLRQAVNTPRWGNLTKCIKRLSSTNMPRQYQTTTGELMAGDNEPSQNMDDDLDIVNEDTNQGK